MALFASRPLGEFSASVPCPAADRVYSGELEPQLGIAATYHDDAPECPRLTPKATATA